jgi:hypothetical protein
MRNIANPAHYDLVVNMAGLSVVEAAGIDKNAYLAKKF